MLFRIHRPLPYGATLYLTGSTETLSKWSVSDALQCKWTDNHVWEVQTNALTIQPPTRFEFKYFSKDSSGNNIDWEPGENHALVITDIPSTTSSLEHLSVNVTWSKGHEVIISSLSSTNNNMVTSPPPTPLDAQKQQINNSIKEKDVMTAVEAVTNDVNNQYIVLTFRIKYKLQVGERMYIIGSTKNLGLWNKMHSPMLQQSRSNNQSYEIQFKLHKTEYYTKQFEYKYFTRRIDGTRRWEDGGNRIALPCKMPRNELIWNDRWEKFAIEFSIFYESDDKLNDKMYITGDIAEIGAWFKPGPVPMTLGPLQLLETDVQGKKWLLKVWVDYEQQDFSYRYILINEKTKFELWEREPNRRAIFDFNRVDDDKNDLKTNSDITLSNKGQNTNITNSIYEFKDVNFVSEMKFDAVPEHMFIGPYPQCESDIEIMAKRGVTGVLNVQTDEDFEHRGIQWNTLKRAYNDNGIKVVRFPIRDFDRDSLRKHLKEAAHGLDDLINDGLDVYIHCTAGMGRAPAVAVAYLCWVHKMDLMDAVKHVKKYRTVAVPNVPVLEQALKDSF